MINFTSTPKIPSEIVKMRETYRENGIPTILTDSLNMLLLTVSIKKPQKILEIGTATGMSGISMLSVAENATLTTIEKDEDSFLEAKANFQKFNFSQKISQYLGDAGEVLNFLDGEFDFIFLDGAKSHYVDYIPDITRLLKSGGVLFADNVLFRGYVDGSVAYTHSDNTIVNNLRSFISSMTNSDKFITQVLKIGDGILISCKI